MEVRVTTSDSMQKIGRDIAFTPVDHLQHWISLHSGTGIVEITHLMSTGQVHKRYGRP